MSSQIGNAPQPHLAIIGLKKAGKSTFLAVLPRALEIRRSPWSIRPVGNTKQEINKLTKRLFQDRLYPLSTKATEDPPDLCFHVERENGLLGLQTGDSFELIAADVPGDAVLGVAAAADGSGSDEGSASGVFHDFYKRYVQGCSAIIFLVDPQEQWLEGVHRDSGDADYYYWVFSSILAEIAEHDSSDIYAAFCITKLDREADTPASFRDPDAGHFYDPEELRQKAEHILGPGTMAAIAQCFKRLQWYAVSATGYYWDDEWKSQCTTHTVDGEELAGIERPRVLEPVGVAKVAEDAFDWIAREHKTERDIKQGARRRALLREILDKFRHWFRR